MHSSYGIVGTGGHARVVVAVARRLGLDLVRAFDTVEHASERFLSIEIRPEAALDAEQRLHLGIGDNAVRRRIDTAHPSIRWITLVDPSAHVSDHVSIGDGCFVNTGAILQTGVTVGRHVIVNTGAIVDHDSAVADFVHLAPGSVVCGGVTIGASVFVGARAVVLPGLTIGEGAVVGAGAVVIRDVPPGATVVGNPAREIGRTGTVHG